MFNDGILLVLSRNFVRFMPFTFQSNICDILIVILYKDVSDLLLLNSLNKDVLSVVN